MTCQACAALGWPKLGKICADCERTWQARIDAAGARLEAGETMVMVETTDDVVLRDALREGWQRNGEMLSHPDSMIVIHIPSLGVQRAAHAALMHLALQRGDACLLKLAPRKAAPIVRQRQAKRAAVVTEPAQLRLFDEAA